MKNIVVFGAGVVGKRLLEIIGKEKVACFADNFPESETCLGLPLIGFDELKERYIKDNSLIIIVASSRYYEEICMKLHANGMGRFYVWPSMGMSTRGRDEDHYYYHKLFEDYEIGKYNRIAIYTYKDRLSLLFKYFSFYKWIDKIKYIVRFNDNVYEDNLYQVPFGTPIPVCADLNEIGDDIDLLILDVHRQKSKLHDLVECNKMPFAVADLRRFLKAVRSPEIVRFKDKHRGERCFIIGNGPSLKMTDLDMLHSKGEVCFGANKIYYAFDETAWRPDYYIVTDAFMLSQYGEDVKKMDIPFKFLVDRCPSFWDSEHSKDIIKVHMKFEAFMPNMPEFSEDFSAYCIEGMNVIYAAIQLAAYMSFEEIYLLGVDFDYSGDMLKSGNHFTEKYVGKNDIRGTPPMESLFLAAKKAEIYSRMHGFRIFNATRGGKLESFERVDFDKLFSHADGNTAKCE